MFEVAEDASSIEPIVNLGIERALALVHEVMNREARYDGIKCAQNWQRVVEVMDDESHGGIAAKALASGFQHGRREIDCDRVGWWKGSFHEREKTSVAGTEIEDAARALGNELKQSRFTLLAMSNRIGALEIVEGMVGLAPKINGHGKV